MKKNTSIHLSLGGLAVLGLLVGCDAGAGGAGASSETAASTPNASAVSAPAAEAPAGEAAGGSGTAQEPGEPAVLDTGYDLSTLRPVEGAANHFPTEGPQPAGAAADGVQTVPVPPAEPTGPTPTIRLADGEEETKDFGQVLQGYKADHTFRLVAEGEVDLVISRVKPSCGCTVADVNLVNADGTRTVYQIGDPIAPGTEFEVKTSIVTDGRQGPMATYVTLYSNEARGFLNLHLKADVMPVLQIDPMTLNFGAITSAQRVEGTVKVVSDVLDPFLLTVDQQFVVEPMTVEAVAVEPDAEGRSKQWELHVALGPKIPEGLRNYPILLKTDVPVPNPKEHPVAGDEEPAVPVYEGRLFVQAQVTGLVSAQPNFLSFGMVRPGQVLERMVKIECHDEFELSEDMPVKLTGLRGEEFQWADNFSWTLTKAEDGSLDLMLRLEGMPEDLTGSFGGVVELAVGHPTKDRLQVRFSGVCRPGVPAANTIPAPQNHAPGDGHDH